LSNLLFGTGVDLPLTTAIASLGPEGLTLLTNALARQTPSQRNNAALALGLCGTAARSAVPALMDCVERGDAGYDVLGALGRIGCDDPRLVKALVRLLQQRDSQTNPNLHEDMAFLLLGLQREKAREAAPLVLAEYRDVANDPNAVAYRRFYRRILKAIAPDMENQLPPPSGPDENSGDWP
jgi:HEAT repeat protein